MAEGQSVSIQDFGATFKGSLEQVVTQSPVKESILVGDLRDHFNKEPTGLPILAEEFELSEHPEASTLKLGPDLAIVEITAGQQLVYTNSVVVKVTNVGDAPTPGPADVFCSRKRCGAQNRRL